MSLNSKPSLNSDHRLKVETGMYSWNSDGLNAMFEDVLLMCKNCSEFNHADETFVQIASTMREHAITYFRDTQLDLSKFL